MLPDASTSNFNSTTLEPSAYENFTSDTRHYYGHTIVAILSVTMVLIMALSFTGNALVILTVARHKGMKTRTNMFLVNLAAADMLTAVCNMPFSMVTILEGDWIFGDAFCQFNGFTLPLFFIVSIHTLMYISIHKYVSITRPFSRAMTSRRLFLMMAASWLWAAFCATSTLHGGNHVLYKKGTSQCGPSIPDELRKYIHSIMITTCNYVIPLMVMCYCYCNIFREIHEHMNRIRETSNIDLQNSLNQQRRISGTLFLVLACFLFCWTPFIIYTCTAAFFRDKVDVPLLANPVAYWCGYLNSACNPIIYALRSPSFRQGYKEILCRYNTFSIGGSLMTKPSLSPTGTVRRSNNRVSVASYEARLISSPKKKPSPFSTPNHGTILERRRKSRDKNSRIPRLSLISTRRSDHHRRETRIDLPRQEKRNQQPMILKRSISLVDFKDDYATGAARHDGSHVSLNNIWINRSNANIGRRQLSKSLSELLSGPSSVPTVFSSDSARYIFSSSDEDLTNTNPTVVVDIASLKSRSSQSANCIREPKPKEQLTTGSLKDRIYVSDSPHTGIRRAELLVDDTKWSPLSVKSLDRGRAQGRSQKLATNRATLFNAMLMRRKSKAPKPDSPLYAASKEQLMQWVSQERLDRLVIRDDMYRKRGASVGYTGNFSPKWLSGLRNKFRYTEAKKDIEGLRSPRTG